VLALHACCPLMIHADVSFLFSGPQQERCQSRAVTQGDAERQGRFTFYSGGEGESPPADAGKTTMHDPFRDGND